MNTDIAVMNAIKRTEAIFTLRHAIHATRDVLAILEVDSDEWNNVNNLLKQYLRQLNELEGRRLTVGRTRTCI